MGAVEAGSTAELSGGDPWKGYFWRWREKKVTAKRIRAATVQQSVIQKPKPKGASGSMSSTPRATSQ